MKKLILMLAVVSATIFASCKSNSEKEEDAVQKVENANENLDEVQSEVQNDQIAKANDAEWQTYKSDANMAIAENETRIAELQTAINKPGNNFDAAYKRNITSLVDKNAALKRRISDYENNQTDWETFKREFDSDMQSFGKAFKDLTVNNKK
ncbi:MAG: hypothetical protein RLZZ312_785 [Bacteroidota bacterium]|jgi:DNA repair ATPase RecN